ncbi:unnamed protein product [Cercospora beticola]|nr:unnamed protein product [Cercospora beticola]
MATSTTYRCRPTNFPRLDTIEQNNHTSIASRQTLRRQWTYHTNPAAAPKGKTALLRCYSRFIADFTGESEVSFQFLLREHVDRTSNSSVVEAEFDDRSQQQHENDKDSECCLDVKETDQSQGPFGFGLELLADLEHMDTLNHAPQLDCPLVIQYHATLLTVVVYYDKDLIDQDYIDAIFKELFNRLSLTAPEGTEELRLSVLNHPPQSHPSSTSQGEKQEKPADLLHAGFQLSASSHPTRLALQFCDGRSEDAGDEAFTYAELDSLTTALAIKLRRLVRASRIPPEQQIIIPAYMAGCIAFYVSWLAVLKAGYAFCPLPVDAPSEQLRGIVEEVGASVVLCNGPQLGGRPWDAWYCDDDELATCYDVNECITRYRKGSLSPMLPNDTLPQVSPSDLAYVMYTSGSTGKPKGVKIHHLAASCSIISHTKFLPTSFMRDGFRWFQFAAPTFDPSIMEIFVTWWTGGTLCSAPRDQLLTDPEQAVNKLAATIMMATPSMASVLRPDRVPTLRHLWTMGEKLTPKVIENFSSDSPLWSSETSHTPRLQRHRRLLNAYGPTEGSINCTIVSNFSAFERGSIIGKPIDTCSILIIDPTSRQPKPVPMGFAGELAIGGPQVSQGYLNRPEQTAAVFVSSSEYGRLYRTGDRARVVKNSKGELSVEFLGRITADQVKLSGRRVELGQIENAIAGVPGIAEVAAIVHGPGSSDQGSQQVLACVVPDHSVTHEDLVADCQRAAEVALAPFMRPAMYVVLENMPRSRSGKTDRKALGVIAGKRWAARAQADRKDDELDHSRNSASADPLMKTILTILSDISNIDVRDILPTTELLSLGLDSLRAVRFLQKLRDSGLTGLNVADVLSSRTPEGIASRVSTETGADAVSESQTNEWDQRLAQYSSRNLEPCAHELSIPLDELETVLPTTATQSGMITSFYRSVSRQGGSPSKKSYINHSIYHARPGADISKLEQAWRSALSGPQIFRTVFLPVDDDLAPFAQCVISPKSDVASLSIRRFVFSDTDAWNTTISEAQKEAESAITLNRPPFRLSIIQGPEHSAFLLSLFHGVFDGGSLELILQDVETAYYNKPQLSRTEIGIAVHKHFSSATQASVDYWQTEFGNHDPVPFPCVSASKPETQNQDVQVEEVIGKATMENISAAAKAASVSPLSILHAAWAGILFSYTGTTSEISFGSVLSDRLEDQLSICHAPTFTVTPVKLDHTAVKQKTLADLLKTLTEKNAASLPYIHAPLSSLTTADGSLPYDTLLAFQAFDTESEDGSIWHKVEHPAMEHDFAIMIEVWPTSSGALRFRGTYTHQHLDRQAALAMLSQLDELVAGICDDASGTLLDLRCNLSQRLMSGILVIDQPNLPESQLILQSRFEQHAATTPEKSALVFRKSIDHPENDIDWSYGKLSRMATALAQTLITRFGAVINEPIMICMEKCPELYIAVLAVLKAGAGWCPIDPYSPPARQHAIMERTESRILLLSATSSKVEKSAIPNGVSTLEIDLDAIEAELISGSNIELGVTHDPSSLAYLIFTSGTTGLPKGVPISHKAAATAMNALAEAVPTETSSGDLRCMQFSQYTFDVFVQDLFYTWSVGGVVISSTRQLMLQNFADIANDLRATHAHLTPAFSATLSRSNIKTLEVVTMIGEKLTEAVAADWGRDTRAFNTYGPAEVTVVSTLRKFTGQADTYHSSNVGVPLPSVGAYVIDNGQIAMRSAIGELALTGPQLSTGYWNMPDVNAKKFVWNEQLQQRVYLTGDLVRHLADGTINYVGRDDDLVKLGGQRVELGEIAFALKDADSRIERFEVLLCKRKEAETRSVVAFLACPSIAGAGDEYEAILHPLAKDVAASAKQYATSVLPPYMIPSSFVVVPRIPTTASAKVDRAKLTSIYHSIDLNSWEDNTGASATTTAKATDIQWRSENEHVLQVIAQVLRIAAESLCPNSSLAAIGIDSIGAIKLIPKINALGYGLSIVDAFKCRSLDDLCTIANASRRADSPLASEQPEQYVEAGVLQSFDSRHYRAVARRIQQDEFTVVPTTVLQENLLAESLRDPQAYWSSHVFRLNEDVDLARLQRAWIKVARQTEALRAGFVPKAELGEESDETRKDNLSYLQLIYDEPHFDWNVHEISSDVSEAARKRVKEVAQQKHEQLFQQPPWAVDIFVRGEERTLLLTISHIIYDGPSLAYLENDVRAAYERTLKTASRASLSEAISSSSALDADSETAIDFWKNSLRDFELPTAQSFATDNKLNHRIKFQGCSTPMEILRKVACGLGLNSVVTIFRTAWALLLSDLLESPHVVFAEILSDRVMDSKLAEVVGPLMSTVPVLFRRQKTAAETMVQQDNFSRSAWPHRNIRPSTIKSLMGCGPSTMLYPAVFAFHPSATKQDQEHKGLWKRLEDITNIEVEHPLALNVWQEADSTLQFELAVADHVLSENEHDLLLRQLESMVTVLAENSHLPVASLTDGFPDALIARTTPRRDTACPSTKSATFYVEHWAAQHPDWKAAEIVTTLDPDCTETESWNYAELNAEANRIARFLLGHGIKKQMIGMCIGRTLMSLAVPLGILKSGNAYLPIDEALPAERKEFLLQDSNAAFIFTTLELIHGVQIPQACKLANVEDKAFLDDLAKQPGDDVLHRCEPRDNAYLLYTSGSTGKPKGVLVSQQNLASFVEAQSEFICDVTTTRELAGRGKYLGLASRAFDVHIGEMFLAWRHGFAITTGLKSMLLDDLALCLSSLHITHASFVPSLLDQTGLDPEDAPDLVFLGVGGEKMSPKTKKKWGSLANVGLINAYGPTEATVGCCSGRLYPNSDARDIGMPLGDSVGHVLIPGTDNYALRGMPGELCFTGSLIANGYLNRPDAKGFVEYFRGQRMYRTGDIVKLRDDDHILFLGRKDDQVKIRGQRVELGEVAEGVREASDEPIDTAALVVRHPELSRDQLVAFMAASGAVKRKGDETPPQIDVSQVQGANTKLRANCQKSLPVYMVPDVIVPLDYIPLAPTSGKVDTKTLVKTISETPMSTFASGHWKTGQKSAVARELTESEERVWDIIAPVLKDKPSSVTPATTIFELGIDSLSAISVFSRLRKAGHECSVAMVMRNPTIEALAQSSTRAAGQDVEKHSLVQSQLANLEQSLLHSNELEVVRGHVAAIRPCLPLQEVLLGQSMHQNADQGKGGAYINHMALKIDSSMDVKRLQSAWETLIRDDEILRTCFLHKDDSFYQIILKSEATRTNWRENDFPSTSSLQAIQHQVEEEIIHNAWTQPPLQVNYLRDHDNTLLISIHHAIYDGHSLYLMFHDLEAIYHDQVRETRLSSQPLVEHIAQQNQARAQTHWSTLLRDWRHAKLLGDKGRSNSTLQEVQRDFNAKLSTLENQIAGSLSVTLSSVLQLAFTIALSQTMQSTDIIFGNVLSGRTISLENADNIMAPCIATVPARVTFANAQGQQLKDVLSTLQKDNSASLEFQHVSPRDIQRWLKADRPLYDCLFSFARKQQEASSTEQNRSLFPDVTQNTITVDYPLAIEFTANSEKDSLTVDLGYIANVFPSEEASRDFLEKVEFLVEAILSRSHEPLSAFGVATTSDSTGGSAQDVHSMDSTEESAYTPLELELKTLLGEFAKVAKDQIRKDTPFIHVGVDSISAIRFAKFLRTKGFKKVSSADLIRNNRVRTLAQFLAAQAVDGEHQSQDDRTRVDDAAQGQERLVKSTLIEHGILSSLGDNDLSSAESREDAIESVYACTPLVSGMLTQSLASDGAYYMHHHAFRCHAGVEIERLKKAWDLCVEDCDVLRTTFHWLPELRDAGSPWVGVVHKNDKGNVKKPDWRQVEVENAHQYWLSLSSEKSDFSRRIESGEPLAGVTVVQESLSDDNNANAKRSPVIILTLHHAIYDGISIGMLFRQLAARYIGNQMPPSITPYYKAAQAIARVAKPAVKFWVEQVRGYEGAPIIDDSASSEFHLAERTITAEPRSLELASLGDDISLKDVLVAAFAKALACLHGRRDVAFGHVMAARTGVEVHEEDGSGDTEIVGPMFNTVPFRVSMKDSLQSNQELVQAVRDVNTGSLEYQHASLAEIQKSWRSDDNSNIDPSAALIDSLFVYTKVDGSADGPSLLTLGKPLESDTAPVPSEYRLNFEVEHLPEGVTARAHASIPKAELETLLDHFQSAVQDILQKPERYATAYPEQLRSLPLKLQSTASKSVGLVSFDKLAIEQYADTIRKAMAEVAQVSPESITLEASIYSFGIDSIAGIQIASRCRKAGLRVSVADILSGGTLGRVCEIVASKLDKATDSSKAMSSAELVSSEQTQAVLTHLAIDSTDIEEVLPLLPGQEYHLQSWLQSGRTLYEPGWTFYSRTRLDADKLRDSWNRLRQSNSVLRTTFAAIADKTVLQVVLRDGAIKVDGFVEVKSDKSMVEIVKETAHAEARAPSDLFSPPIRLRLVKAADGDAVMLYVHHALYDAWSMPRLITELANIYQGGEPDSAPSFSALVRHTIQSRDPDAEKTFWRQTLTGAEKAIIPSASKTRDDQDRSQSFCMIESTTALLADIEQVCASHSISPQHVMLVAFARALANVTATSSPMFGFFQLGRSTAFDGIEHVLGPMVNTLPWCVPEVLKRDVLDSIRKIQQMLSARVAYEQSSLRTAVQAADPGATQLPFNAYLNVLWNKNILIGSGSANEEDNLFQPLALGVPTDYSSPQALPGRTAVDALDTNFLQSHQVFVDVGPGEKGIVFGVRADAALMSVEGIRGFVGSIEQEIVACVAALRK